MGVMQNNSTASPDSSARSKVGCPTHFQACSLGSGEAHRKTANRGFTLFGGFSFLVQRLVELAFAFCLQNSHADSISWTSAREMPVIPQIPHRKFKKSKPPGRTSVREKIVRPLVIRHFEIPDCAILAHTSKTRRSTFDRSRFSMAFHDLTRF